MFMGYAVGLSSDFKGTTQTNHNSSNGFYMLAGLPGCTSGGGGHEFRNRPCVHHGNTPKWNSKTLIDLSGTNAPNNAGIAHAAHL